MGHQPENTATLMALDLDPEIQDTKPNIEGFDSQSTFEGYDSTPTTAATTGGYAATPTTTATPTTETTKRPSDVTILDGGMGHMLRRLGVEIKGERGTMKRFLGVALANIETPNLVLDAHLAYIDAGSTVITTNSYSCVPRCLNLAGADDLNVEGDPMVALIEAAGKLARQACDKRPNKNVKVAGCLPPLNESYRPDKVGPFKDNVETYRRIAKVIAPYADVLVCETMSKAEEALAACTAALETGLPVWVAWTLNDDKPELRSGESVVEAAKLLATLGGEESWPKGIEACLFNCTSPESITAAMPLLDGTVPKSVRIGGYANGFSKCGNDDPSKEYRDLSGEEYNAFVKKWIASGASAIGGCCGVFPEHICHVHNFKKELSDLASAETSDPFLCGPC